MGASEPVLLQHTAFRQPPLNALSESGTVGIKTAHYAAGLHVMTKSENIDVDTIVSVGIDCGTLCQHAAFLEMTASGYLEGNVISMSEVEGFGAGCEEYGILNELSTQVGCLQRELILLTNFGTINLLNFLLFIKVL